MKGGLLLGRRLRFACLACIIYVNVKRSWIYLHVQHVKPDSRFLGNSHFFKTMSGNCTISGGGICGGIVVT